VGGFERRPSGRRLGRRCRRLPRRRSTNAALAGRYEGSASFGDIAPMPDSVRPARARRPRSRSVGGRGATRRPFRLAGTLCGCDPSELQIRFGRFHPRKSMWLPANARARPEANLRHGRRRPRILPAKAHGIPKTERSLHYGISHRIWRRRGPKHLALQPLTIPPRSNHSATAYSGAISAR